MLDALIHTKSTFFLYIFLEFIHAPTDYTFDFYPCSPLFYKFIRFKSHYLLHTYFKLKFLGDSFIIIMSFTFNVAIDMYFIYSNSLSLRILRFVILSGQYLCTDPIILPLYLFIISSYISAFFFFLTPILFCLMQTPYLLSLRHPLC